MDKFWSYWNRIKYKLREMVKLPGEIALAKRETADLRRRATKLNNPSIDKALLVTQRNLNVMTPEASSVAAKVKKYEGTWKGAAQTQPNLGVIFTVLGVAAIGAAGYVAVKGLRILTEFKQERGLIDSFKKRVISLEEAKGLISATKGPSLVTARLGMGSMLIPLALVGAGAWFFMSQKAGA